MNPNNEERHRTIIRYSMAGIIMNLLMAVFKITAGIVAHAHAVMLDGVNSLSDMISSLLTILSSYIAGKRGTKDHPLGYGRLEYISSFVVTVIIMYVGARTLVEAVKTIIHPHEPPEYSPLVIAIMVVSLVCKIIYGTVMRKRGRRLDSDAMIMTGTESLGDALISLAILAAIAIYRVTGADIEHYLCIIISLMILHTGATMIKDCIDKILGVRLADDERKRIAAIPAGFDEVMNVSNLAMHNYGENYYHFRQYHTKSKGAQEAHEAIRPTFIENVTIEGTPQEKKLYDLIWKRTVASQMAESRVMNTTMKVAQDHRPEKYSLQSVQIMFDGFMAVYLEGRDDEPADASAAGPLQRGNPGAEDGGTWNRPSFNLCCNRGYPHARQGICRKGRQGRPVLQGHEPYA